MGKILGMIGIASALLALGVWSWHRAAPPEELRPQVIVVFGDSLVRGVGASQGGDLVAVLSARIGMPLVNRGRSGDTTASALTRLDEEVLAEDPGVVVILLGGNDALARVPQHETFRNLGEIVDRIKAKGARPLLVGIQGGAFGDPYRAAFDALAREKEVAFVPDILRGIFNDPDLMADSIHPNDAGYLKMAEKIEPVLRGLLREK
jgi:acyl-CoA thioesterase I